MFNQGLHSVSSWLKNTFAILTEPEGRADLYAQIWPRSCLAKRRGAGHHAPRQLCGFLMSRRLIADAAQTRCSVWGQIAGDGCKSTCRLSFLMFRSDSTGV